MLGSETVIRTVLTHDEDINKVSCSAFGCSWINESMYTLVELDWRGRWMVSSPGMTPTPLEDFVHDAYVGQPETTYKFIVMMSEKAHFLPRSVYNSLVALVELPNRNLWIARKYDLTPWTTNGYNEYQLYQMTKQKEGDYSYVILRDYQDGSGIEIDFSDEPAEIIFREEVTTTHKINDVVCLEGNQIFARIIASYPDLYGDGQTFYAIRMSQDACNKGYKKVEIIKETNIIAAKGA